MTVKPEQLIGGEVPKTTLGLLKDGEIQAIDARMVFSNGKVVAIGVPGVYTPVCTERHIPDFVRNAAKLKRNGYGKLICIAPNDPFVLERWARELDPYGRILFLADGNLEFARALGLTAELPSLYLGERCERFMMITVNGKIQKIKVEPDVLTFSCTGSEDALAAGGDVCLI